MQARSGSSSRLLDLPQPALEAVASSLGCAAANARRAHPVLCAAIDRQLPAVTINATSSRDIQGLRLSHLPQLRWGLRLRRARSSTKAVHQYCMRNDAWRPKR
jgi:hypothetical protein